MRPHQDGVRRKSSRATPDSFGGFRRSLRLHSAAAFISACIAIGVSTPCEAATITENFDSFAPGTALGSVPGVQFPDAPEVIPVPVPGANPTDEPQLTFTPP